MSLTAGMIGFSFIIIGMMLLIGKWIRMSTPVLQRLFLPSSIIAGILALLVGPEVLGKLINPYVAEGSYWAGGLIPTFILDVWATIPGLMINVVFAALFLGKTIPGLKKIWMITGPQVCFGQTVAWGQYVFGILLAVTILVPFFGMSPMSGALIEIGFEGGHGTAAGLAGTFEELGFAEGADLALGLATIGVLAGVIIGIVLINWGVRTGRTEVVKARNDIPKTESIGIVEYDVREPAGKMTTRPESIEPLSFHLAYIGIAIAIGYGLHQALIWLESVSWGQWTDTYLMTYIPLFPLAMVGGVIVQLLLEKFDQYQIIDREIINRIQGLALDLLIVTALATLSLTVIGDNLVPFLLMAVVAIVWNVMAFIVIAPRMIPTYWFERGIGDLGQSMGMTATGLLLMRIADPKAKTPAFESFGYKQLLFEPVVGGGLFTAASVPLIFQFGAVPILFLSLAVMIAWLCVGIFLFGRK
jgi:ESS family glutamate:Na+ symporter